jgi:hypothetical protein
LISYIDSNSGSPKPVYKPLKIETFRLKNSKSADVEYEKLSDTIVMIKATPNTENITNIARQIIKNGVYGEYKIFDQTSDVKDYLSGKVNIWSDKGYHGKIYFEEGSKPGIITTEAILKME